MGFIKSETYTRGMFLSLLFNVFARLSGLAASLVIGFYFGAGRGADIYFYSLGAITLVSGFIVALNGAAVIPEMMRIDAARGRRAAIGFANGFLCVYLCAGAAAAAAAFWRPAEIFGALSRFDSEALAGAAPLLRLAGLALAFNIANVFMADVAAANKLFTLPMISNVLLNGAVIACVLASRASAIAAAMTGLVLGGALQSALLAALLRRHAGWDFCTADFRAASRAAGNIFYSQAGNAASLLAGYLPLYLLSGCGQGAVSAMNYARQPADMPHLALTNQFSAVAGIKFNEAAASAKTAAELDPVFSRAARALVFPLACAAAFICAFSGEIMRILYLRGRMDAHTVNEAAAYLMILALAIPFAAFNTLAARLNMAFGRLREAMFYQIFSGMAAAAVFALCVPAWGARGYAAATAVFAALNAAGLWLYFRKVYPGINYSAALEYLAPACAAALAALAAALPAKLIPAGPAWQLAAGFSLYCIAALLINNRYRLNGDIDDFAKSLLRGRPGL
ncbi:MAG: lipid II flippase MurJ [Elusimicrobiales bacterium]